MPDQEHRVLTVRQKCDAKSDRCSGNSFCTFEHYCHHADTVRIVRIDRNSKCEPFVGNATQNVCVAQEIVYGLNRNRADTGELQKSGRS